MEARGIDPRPFVDGIGEVHYPPMQDGRVLRLALEDDPLQIFQMGERFGTCLSIGATNYFSVFANAADIDKRVLYIREKDGHIVGRCLLALDDEGHLISFNAYGRAPSNEAEIATHVGMFARDLAERMGTVTSPRGRIRARVAKEWYDDGPQDHAQQFPFLAPGSAFSRALEEATPADVMKLATDAFAPRPLDGVTLPLLLAHHALDRKPELARPFLALLEQQGGPLSDALRLTTARLAHGAGDVARARALAGKVAFTELEAGLGREPDHVSQVLIDLALDLDPAAVLAVLRRVARKKDQPLGSERSDFVRAEAFERLGRLRRALTLLRGLEDSWLSTSVREAIERVERKLTERRARAAP
jgi:hypothetical protein